MNHSFASDNTAGAHSKVLREVQEMNKGTVAGYGEDIYTKDVLRAIRNLVHSKAQVFLVGNGTAANVLGLSAMLLPHEGVLCAETAHIHEDEAGAVERFTGSRLMPVPSVDGKLTPLAIRQQLVGTGDRHRVQPRVVSISQPTEYGTVYSIAELRDIVECVRENDLFLHMDGARIANALAYLRASLKALTDGVDVLSFGGTKNGALGAEAVVFLRYAFSSNFEWIRKQGMQLNSKMRFLAAQFMALLEDDLWLHNAGHANRMAYLLADALSDFYFVTITRPVQSNAVFLRMPHEIIERLLDTYAFHVWDREAGEVRFMTSWATSEEDVAAFVNAVKRAGGLP